MTMQTTPELVAHRGHAREFPENTLPALASAIELGLRFVEFDVQLAADLTPVVIHDDELARTCGIQGSVFERTAAELTAIEAAERERFGVRHAGVTIPLLDSVVALLARYSHITAFVEIKRASLRRFGHETVLSRVLHAIELVRTQCVVISFDPQAVQLAREAGFQAGWVLTRYDEPSRQECERLRPEYLFCNYEKLPPDASPLWPGPWRWALYEVTDANLAQTLVARGASLLETMAAADLLAALRSRQPA
jgi:glycerophosphoryl diester phosphodiesterase